MSAASHLEAAIVIDSARDPVASRSLDQFIAEAGNPDGGCDAIPGAYRPGCLR